MLFVTERRYFQHSSSLCTLDILHRAEDNWVYYASGYTKKGNTSTVAGHWNYPTGTLMEWIRHLAELCSLSIGELQERTWGRITERFEYPRQV